MSGMEIATMVGVLKVLPDIVDAGKVLWKKLVQPEKLAIGPDQDGVIDRTYFSGPYKFALSVPDDNWRFWKPSAEFRAGIGPMLATPYRDMPIMVMAKQMIRLFRPNVNVVVEDVGTFATLTEIMLINKQIIQRQGGMIDPNQTHLSDDGNVGIVVASQSYFDAPLYQVFVVYLRAGRTYTLIASYVPMSDDHPVLFGGLKEILDSFRFIE